MPRPLRVLLRLLVVVFIFSAVITAANVPQIINFQGRLTNNLNNPQTGSLSFTFKFFDSLSGGNLLPVGSSWSETQTISVTNGVFNALIGSVTPIPYSVFNSTSVFMEITVGGETLSPRETLVTSPFAFNAQALSGLTFDAFVDTSTNQTIDGVKTFSSFPSKSGSVTPVNPNDFATKSYVDTVGSGGGAFIDLQDTLQAGATFYVSSGTVAGTLQTGTLNLVGGPLQVNGSAGGAGQVLQSNGVGAAPSWVPASAASVGGSNTQIQYNNSGGFGGAANTSVTASSITINEAVGLGASGAVVTISSNLVVGAAGTLITMSPLTASQYVKTDAGKNLISGTIQASDIPSGSNNYIQNSSVLQSGATFYVSSGTVAGTYFDVGGSTFVVTGGDVGIGTAAPGTNLDVVGSATVTVGMRVYNQNSGAGSNAAILLGNNTSNSQGSLFVASPNSGVYPANGLILYQTGNNPLSLWTNNNSRMTINGSGNMGIGTASPATKLHMSSGIFTLDGAGSGISMVAGSSLTLNGTLMANGAAGTSGQVLQSNGPGAAPSWAPGGGGGALLNSTNTWTAQQTYTDQITISSNLVVNSGRTDLTDTNGADAYSLRVGSSTSAYNLVVTTSGNVGIGITNPAYPLDVSGIVRIGGFTDGNLSPLNVTGLSGNGSAITLYNGDDPTFHTVIYSNNTGFSVSPFRAGFSYLPATMDGSSLIVNAGTSGHAEAMRVDTTGNVGIGNTSPATKLHMSSGIFTLDGAGSGISMVAGSSLTLNGTLMANGAAGTSGQVLQSNGPGAAPSWAPGGGGTTLLNSTNTWTAQQNFNNQLTISSNVVVSSGSIAITNGQMGSTIHQNGTCGGALSIDWSTGNSQYVQLTGACTLSFSNGLSGRKYTLILQQDSMGSRTVTWPAAAHFSGAVTPILTATASATDYLGFVYNDVSTHYDNVAQALNY